MKTFHFNVPVAITASTEDEAKLWFEKSYPSAAVVQFGELQPAEGFTAQTVCDLVITCLEGGSTYWADRADLVEPHQIQRAAGDENLVWWGHLWLYQQPNFRISITDEDGGTHVLDPAAVRRGYERLKSEYPTVWGRIHDDWDAEDADIWLQLCLFGEVIYG